MPTVETIPGNEDTNRLFPIFLKLEKLRLLIVGGGYVGMEKLTAVMQNAPATNILLVATTISNEIKALASRYSNIVLKEKPFDTTDLDDRDLVIIGINDRTASKVIYETAKGKGKLVNVADTPDLCDFYLSSIVQKGNLKVAISTNGKSPTVAKRVKEVINELIPDEIDELLDNIQKIRGTLDGDFEEKVRKLNELTRGLLSNKS